jgi:predicted AAA+ superfamily ATPase
MSMQKILKRYNPWWYGEYKSIGIKRERYLEQMRKYPDWPHVIFLVGMRRVGKTTLMRQSIEEKTREIDPMNILYISLDHPWFSGNSIIDIVEEFRTLNGISNSDTVEVHLDEVHLHEGFERDLKVIHDMENAKIFASGSASVFPLEKGSYLTGRQHFIDISPFDFEEYIEFLDIKIKPDDENLKVKISYPEILKDPWIE